MPENNLFHFAQVIAELPIQNKRCLHIRKVSFTMCVCLSVRGDLTIKNVKPKYKKKKNYQKKKKLLECMRCL